MVLWLTGWRGGPTRLVLLDDGMSCEAIAKVLLLDDDTIRTWYRLYETRASKAWRVLVMTAARAA